MSQTPSNRFEEMQKQEENKRQLEELKKSSDPQVAARIEFYSKLGRPELATKYDVFQIPTGQRVRYIEEKRGGGLIISFYDIRALEAAKAEQKRSREFFTSIGYSQFGGRYQPFEIPQGKHVGDIKEANEGLIITFHDTSEETKSVEFFTSIGYGQYGGKYQPFDIPKGMHVGDIKETSEGLNVVFHDTEEEAKQQAEIKKSVDFFTSIGYGQYGGKYAPFEVPEGASISRIVENDSGLTVEFFTPQEIQEIGDYGGGFVIHPDMKAAMTRQQEAYATPSLPKKGALTPSNYWSTDYNPTAFLHNPDIVKIVPPEGQRVVPGSIKLADDKTFSYQLEPITSVQIKNPMVEPTLLNLITNPVGVASTVLNLASTITAKETSLMGNIVNAEIGAAGFYLNLPTEIKNAIVTKQPSLFTPSSALSFKDVGRSIVGTQTEKLLYTPKSEVQEFGMASAKVGSIAALAVAAPIVGPELGLSAGTVIASEGVSVGISQGVKAAQGGGLLTVEEVAISAAEGGAFTLFNVAALKGVGKIAPTVVASRMGRVGLSTVIGASGGYILSGGDVVATAQGAILGGGLGVASELAPGIIGAAKTKIGKSHLLDSGTKTIGSLGREVQAFVSEPVKELGGKRLRVIFDVTEKPVGTKGVTVSSMIDDYVGKNVPTSHATLMPESFNLKAGGETVLKGFPEMSKGFRSAEQLYHFYSAPGSDEFVNVYGGYVGFGKGYSGAVKVMIGGKPTALVTLDTKVSPKMLPMPNESQTAFLSRISQLSGETGISPETILGKSMERQLSTPASYERFGVQLPGSKFVSEGKVGTFTLKTTPEGLLGRIPLLRTIFTDYQSLQVVKGRYAPTTSTATAKILNVAKYNQSYGKIISVPSRFLASPSTFIKPLSSSKIVSEISRVSKTVRQQSISVASKPNVPSFVSQKSSQVSSFKVKVSSSKTISVNKQSSIISASEAKVSSSKQILSSVTSSTTLTSSKASRINSSLTLSPSQLSSISSYSSSNSTVSSLTQSSTSKISRSFSPLKINKPGNLLGGIGGTGLGKGGKDAFKGRWHKQKNPIKTPQQMLKDFSSFGSGKRVKIFKQSQVYNNLFKQSRRGRKR